MEKALIVKGLTKHYGNILAVDNLNLNISKGEIFGLLGHNGAGKTTSLECILGVKKPDSGFVRILEMDPAKERKQLFQKVGVQFQETKYQEKITVGEICKVTDSLYHDTYPWKELLTTFGLSEMKTKPVAELSGGQRQRLSVLLALIPNPELVFLDELTTGLDAKARREVWKFLEELKKKGLTIVLTSHYMDEVNALCDRICILKRGKTIVSDTIGNVMKNSPYENLEDAYLWYSGEEAEENENISCNA